MFVSLYRRDIEIYQSRKNDIENLNLGHRLIIDSLADDTVSSSRGKWSKLKVTRPYEPQTRNAPFELGVGGNVKPGSTRY